VAYVFGQVWFETLGGKIEHRTGSSRVILSVQSNQFVQSKMQFVQSKMRNCAVQKLKVEDIIVQFSKSILKIKLINV